MTADALVGAAGSYRIARTISDGMMAAVHEGVDIATGARVAIKVLGVDASRDPPLKARFAREIRANERLRGRHVVRMVDHGTHAGLPFMVMELLEGDELARTLKQRGLLPVAETAALMLQVACGLAEAHATGIVHRDVKPGNILVDRGTPRIARVLDFGISKLDETDDSIEDELTRSFSTLGTPAYMSPEQIRSARTVDRATDVWSFGTVLFRALAGRLPFDGNASSLPLAICEDPPASLRALRPDAPDDLVEVIEAALEKDKRLRPTLADLGDVLVNHLDRSPDAAIAHEAYTELARLSLADL